MRFSGEEQCKTVTESFDTMTDVEVVYRWKDAKII